MAKSSERIMPHDVDSEACVLGSMILNKDAISMVVDKLTPDHFFYSNYSILFRAISEMYRKNLDVDLVTLSDYLNKKNWLDEVGGRSGVVDVLDTVPTWHNVERYADIVIDKAMKRSLVDIGMKIADDAFSEAEELDDMLELAQKGLLDITNKKIRKRVKGISDVMDEVLGNIQKAEANDGKILGIPSGLKDLDQMLLGFKKSDLIILAARPSVGKTALALNFAHHAAKNNIPTLFFSIEMASDQLGTRLLSMESGVDSKSIQTAKFTSKDQERTMEGMGKLADYPLFIEDTGGLSTLEMRAITRQMMVKSDIKLIVIDYLQLMRGTNQRRNENRMQEVSEVVREIKAFAKEVQIPIIALSQLRRGVEDRADKRPQLSDLRETGEIEQTADVVMFLHRDDYYNQATVADNVSEEDKKRLLSVSKTELIISKHRNGETGVVNLMYKRNISKFMCGHVGPVTQ